MIYDGCDLSEGESSLLIFSFIVRHGISAAAVEDLLFLMKIHLPAQAKTPLTRHALKNSIGFDYSQAVRHYYCSKCSALIEKSRSRNQTCNSCHTEIDFRKLENLNSFFIHFPIENILKQKLQNPVLSNSLAKVFRDRKKDRMHYSDITDGKLYKSLKLGDHDFTCSVNSDGVPVFKSSNVSLWPLLISINELNINIRRKETMIAALWIGNSKPEFDTFLQPFVSDSKRLVDNGIKWNLNGVSVHSKVYFPVFVADSVARCAVQEINQFNGDFGCPWCLAKGSTLRLPNNKWKRIYPPISKSKIVHRYHSTFIGHLRNFSEALTSNPNTKSVYGVKKASKLLLVPKFNIVNGFVFDYMHTCLLGITRTITNAWLDSTNHDKPFYIRPKNQENISRLFLKCRIPAQVQRSVRSLNHRRFWKSSEWKVWLHVSPIVMRNFLADNFFNHFMLFVKAFYILTSTKMTDSEVNTAENLLFKFVSRIPQLYGESFCSSNCHLLLHAAECTRNWGPIINYSAFQFENFNQVILNSFKGSHKVVTQICNRAIEIASLPLIAYCRIQSQLAAYFFDSQINNRKSTLFCKKIGDLVMLGRSQSICLTLLQIIKLKLFGCNVKQALSYKNVLIHGKLYSVETKSVKRCNSIVKIHDSMYTLNQILEINSSDNPSVVGFVTKLDVSFNDISNVMDIVSVSNVEIVVNLNLVKMSKFYCFKESDNTITHVVRLPNILEVE